MSRPLVSIVIPAYNEEGDIQRTLEAAVSLSHPAKEVLLVDDASTDRTVEVARPFGERHGVRILRQDRNRGVAAARNRGIREARGEIVVILNADVTLPRNFIEAILPHYEQGADYVLVESRVSNMEYVFPRYVEAQHRFFYGGSDSINWTEGFSCRRAAAIAVGLFPEAIPGASGEDAVFGERLAAGHRKVIDRSIVVTHVVPHHFREFWQQRKGRGRGTTYRLSYEGVTRGSMAWRLLKNLVKTVLLTLAPVVPLWREASRLSQHSLRGRADRLPFTFAAAVDLLGQRVGEWEAFWRVLRRVNRE